MFTAQVLKAELVKGESVTVFDPAAVTGWERQGYIVVRQPRFDYDPYILHKPSEILITWVYQGREITADKKKAIMDAYSKSGHKMQRLTDAAFKRFLDDLHSGKILAKFSKYRPSDIFFIVK